MSERPDVFPPDISTSTPAPADLSSLAPGQLLARGVGRCLSAMGFAPLMEFTPERGRRVDVMALGPKGQVWIVECKSSLADFRSDTKWQGYLPWCDQFFWAVDTDFPQEVLPPDTGLILADAWDAHILRHGPAQPLAAARRKALTLRFAQNAALRLQRLHDPVAGAV